MEKQIRLIKSEAKEFRKDFRHEELLTEENAKAKSRSIISDTEIMRILLSANKKAMTNVDLNSIFYFELTNAVIDGMEFSNDIRENLKKIESYMLKARRFALFAHEGRIPVLTEIDAVVNMHEFEREVTMACGKTNLWTKDQIESIERSMQIENEERRELERMPVHTMVELPEDYILMYLGRIDDLRKLKLALILGGNKAANYFNVLGCVIGRGAQIASNGLFQSDN